MFTREFDVFMAVILGILMLLCFTGRAGGVMNMFGGRNDPTKKKRSEEEEREFQKACGYFIVPLFAAELLCVFLANQVSSILLAVIALVDLIVFAVLMRGK